MSYNNYGGGYDQNGGYENNYSNTSYGAQGGADGGGFLPGGSQDASKRAQKVDTLRPLTIRQAWQAEEVHSGGEMILEGVEVSRISIIGHVRSVTKLTTNVMLKLDDGTASIEARVWLDTDAQQYDEHGDAVPDNIYSPKEGDWVRVLGTMKFIGSKRMINVINVKQIKDMNEINYHLLEATYVHLVLTKGPIDPAQGNGDTGAMQGVQSGYQQQSNGATGGALAGFSSLAGKVYQKLQAEGGNEGVHLDLVARELGLSYAQVKKAADELYEGSKIFTTVDDDTFAVLED